MANWCCHPLRAGMCVVFSNKNGIGGSIPRICVVMSAGGSAFECAFNIAGLRADSFFIVTDRMCGAEVRAKALGIECVRLPKMSRDDLSVSIDQVVRQAGCEIILLHFDRLVTPTVYEKHLTFNVHPSLLPAFPGLDGVAAAAKANSLYQGATLHIVDGGVDTGPIVSQTVHQVPLACELAWRHRLSYVQKAAMTLSLIDFLKAGRIDHRKRGIEAVDFSGISSGKLVQPDYLDARFSIELEKLLRYADAPSVPAP
jgi:phosphoribosylglycinamide formyltransferase-1